MDTWVAAEKDTWIVAFEEDTWVAAEVDTAAALNILVEAAVATYLLVVVDAAVPANTVDPAQMDLADSVQMD